MRAILSAFDLSKQSENALITASSISKAFSFELHVIHFISPSAYGLSTPEMEKQEKYNKIQDFLNQHNISAKIHTKIPSKPIAYEIIETAKEIEASLIAIGRSSYDVQDINFIGSNALSLKNTSEIPILFGTLKPKVSFRNILLTINEKPYSLEPLRFAIDFSKKTDAKLHLLYVIESNFPVPVEEIRLEEGKIDENLKLYKPLLSEIDYSLNVVISEYASKGILEYTDKNDVDIIIMSRRKSLNLFERLFYSSNTLRVIRGATVPVIAF